MLSAYLDDSGTHPGSSVCVLAGAIATPVHWERLSAQWAATLESFGTKDFHATDCANGGGSFKGWESERRNALYSRLTKITRQHVAFRTWSVVALDDYRQMFKEQRKEPLPFGICAMGCASTVRRIALKRDLYIPYVFDSTYKAGRIFKMFEELLRKRNNLYRMGMLSKGDRVTFPPLQAADLIAYETYRYFSDQLAGKNREPRKSFLELMQIKDLGGYFLGAEKLSMLISGNRKRVGGNAALDIPNDYLDKDHLLRVERVSPRLQKTPEEPGG